MLGSDIHNQKVFTVFTSFLNRLFDYFALVAVEHNGRPQHVLAHRSLQR
jgi:hypothetical protein